MTHRCPVFVRDEATTEHALYGVVHADASLECTECPEADMFIVVIDGNGEGERADGTDERAEFCVEDERLVCRGTSVGGSVAGGEHGDDGCVAERTKHHGDHEAGEDITQGECGCRHGALLE